ncbi:MAG: hypothetical protein IT256_03985 [Chitinophagaceae bacterium]|nr:hypothetical protein [Chitinophagaceae bacterium]
MAYKICRSDGQSPIAAPKAESARDGSCTPQRSEEYKQQPETQSPTKEEEAQPPKDLGGL